MLHSKFNSGSYHPVEESRFYAVDDMVMAVGQSEGGGGREEDRTEKCIRGGEKGEKKRKRGDRDKK